MESNPPTADRYDVCVVGSGPAGQRAAIELARAGRRVSLIEKQSTVGGVCLHAGTIPSKAFRTAVLVMTNWRYESICCAHRRPAPPRPEAALEEMTSRLMEHVFDVTDKELSVIKKHMTRYGVDVIYGEARFRGPHHLVVDDNGQESTLQADAFVLACGTEARRPASIPFNDKTIIDSDQLYTAMTRLPQKLIIIGAGVIGMEYASIFSVLGVEVHVLNRRGRFLGFIDDEVILAHLDGLKRRGVHLHRGAHIQQLVDKDPPKVILEDGTEIEGDLVMVAAGRVGTAGRLDLDTVGLETTDRGLLEVNDHFQTPTPHIYAAGDIIGAPSLAATSKEQGRLAARGLLGRDVDLERSEEFPFGVYTIPEMSWVGRTQAMLDKEKVPYVVGRARFSEIAKGEMLGDESGFLKILVDRKHRRILGAHAFGTDASEIIHLAHILMRLEGTLDHLLDWVFNYPTLAESYKIAAFDAETQLASTSSPPPLRREPHATSHAPPLRTGVDRVGGRDHTSKKNSKPFKGP